MECDLFLSDFTHLRVDLNLLSTVINSVLSTRFVHELSDRDLLGLQPLLDGETWGRRKRFPEVPPRLRVRVDVDRVLLLLKAQSYNQSATVF